jgi:NAD-dependent SIR2 family protein deacetylase
MKKLIEKLEEQGRGMGPGGKGLGPGGKCKCPKCGHEEEHVTAEACMDKACPKCGAKMVREDIDEAAMTPFDKAIKKIAKQTDYNDHGGAILTAANLIGAKSIVERIKLVIKLHDIEGSMPKSLSDYRYELQKELKTAAEKKLPPEQLDKLLMAL